MWGIGTTALCLAWADPTFIIILTFQFIMELNFLATTVAGLEDALANQATVVSQLSVECQSLTQRLEASSLKHKY